MKKIIDYFFVFTKLLTSLVMLFIILVLGYLLFKSYSNEEQANLNIDNKILLLSDTINNNNLDIQVLSKKLTESNKDIDQLEKSIKLLPTKSQIKNYSEEIVNVKNLIQKLQIKIESLNVKSEISNNIDNLTTPNDSNNIRINSYVDLMIIKFKNGENYNNEIKILEKLVPSNKKIFLEKINLINLKKFYGIVYLEEEFDRSISVYAKKTFLLNNQNSIINFISKFITIRPSNISEYQNQELNILMRAKDFMHDEKISDSLTQVMLIRNSEIFFIDWIEQAKIYLDFMTTIEKVF